MNSTSSQTRTWLTAVSIIASCSLLVSLVITVLRPIQAANNAPAQSQHLLITTGLLKKNQSMAENTNLLQHIENKWLDLDKAELSAPVNNRADYRSIIEDATLIQRIEKPLDIAQLGTRPKVMPIHFIHSNASKARVVLPVYGKGMWSMIHGYVALADDFNTIVGVNFYQQQDTPGIGDKIQAEDWAANWQGKKLYDEQGQLKLNIGSDGGAIAPVHQIDAIAGATITVNGVENLVHYWMGEDGYGRYLRKLREASGP